MIDLTSTITLLELIYTLTGVCGVLYAYRFLRCAELDRQGLISEGLNGGRRLASSINVAIGRAMFVKLSIYVVVGCLAMTLPNANGADPPWQTTVSAFLFLTGQGIAVGLMAYINRQYDAMARYFDKKSTE